MATIDYMIILILFALLVCSAIVECLINLSDINKRIDILEKREQMRQLEQRKDQTYIQSKDLFKEW